MAYGPRGRAEAKAARGRARLRPAAQPQRPRAEGSGPTAAVEEAQPGRRDRGRVARARLRIHERERDDGATRLLQAGRHLEGDPGSSAPAHQRERTLGPGGDYVRDVALRDAADRGEARFPFAMAKGAEREHRSGGTEGDCERPRVAPLAGHSMDTAQRRPPPRCVKLVRDGERPGIPRREDASREESRSRRRGLRERTPGQLDTVEALDLRPHRVLGRADDAEPGETGILGRVVESRRPPAERTDGDSDRLEDHLPSDC